MQPLLLLVAPLWVATLGLTSPTPDNPNNVLSVSLRDLGHDQQSPRSTSSIASQAADESLNKRGGSSSRPEPARLPDSDLVWRDRHGVDDLLTQWDSILKNSLEASSSSSVKHNIPTELERDFLYFFLATSSTNANQKQDEHLANFIPTSHYESSIHVTRVQETRHWFIAVHTAFHSPRDKITALAYFWEAAHFKDQQHTNHIINQREWNLDILKQAGNTIPEIKYTYARRLRPKKHRTNHDLLVEINKLATKWGEKNVPRKFTSSGDFAVYLANHKYKAGKDE